MCGEGRAGAGVCRGRGGAVAGRGRSRGQRAGRDKAGEKRKTAPSRNKHVTFSIGMGGGIMI